MSSPQQRRTEDAHRLARRLFEVTDQVRATYEKIASSLGLTPVQARAVHFLEQPVPMRALAAHLECDASNVTGVADRLEAQGYVERVSGRDRRVRLLQLTPSGQTLRADLAERVAHAPSPADRLTPAERTELHALLDKMLGQ